MAFNLLFVSLVRSPSSIPHLLRILLGIFDVFRNLLEKGCCWGGQSLTLSTRLWNLQI